MKALPRLPLRQDQFVTTTPPRASPAEPPALSLWVVAAGSKIVVLELVDLVFGDSVSLGGFIPVTLLVVALLWSRAAVRRLLYDTPSAS